MKRLLLSIFIMMSVWKGSISGGDSLLHVAAREGSIEQVKDLLAKGANPFITNSKGLMPVQNAANNEIRFMLIVAMNEYSLKAKKKE